MRTVLATAGLALLTAAAFALVASALPRAGSGPSSLSTFAPTRASESGPAPAGTAALRDLAASVFAPREAPSDWGTSPTATPRAVALTADAVRRGSRLFFLNACYACHGGGAEGYVGPRLAGMAVTYEQVLAQVRAPQTGRMPPFTPAQMRDDDVADIYAFLRSLPGP